MPASGIAQTNSFEEMRIRPTAEVQEQQNQNSVFLAFALFFQCMYCKAVHFGVVHLQFRMPNNNCSRWSELTFEKKNHSVSFV